MFKKVLYDYFKSLRWENVKKASNFSAIWLVVYMLVLFPSIIHLFDDLSRTIEYYGMMIVLMFGIYTASFTILCLPKQMYLCPITKEERKEYLNYLCWIKILVPMILWIGVQIILEVFVDFCGWKSVIYSLCIFSSIVSITIAPAGSMGIMQTEEGKNAIRKPVFKGMTAISVSNLLCAILLVVTIIAFLETGDKGSFGFGLFAGFIIVLQVIFDIILFARYKKPVIEYGVTYEKNEVKV